MRIHPPYYNVEGFWIIEVTHYPYSRVEYHKFDGRIAAEFWYDKMVKEQIGG